MKHKVCFLVIALMALFARAQAVERPGSITLKQGEIAEILAAQESYAYFGREICSLISDLPEYRRMAHDAKLDAKHLDALHELVAQGYMTAPSAMVKAALEEAAQCLAACKASMSEEMARMAEALEAYDHALQSGAADVIVADEADDSSDMQTRGTKKFDNVLVRNQASIGALYVGGDTIINHNLTVNGSETILGNLTVNGAIIFTSTGSEIVDGNLIVIGNTTLGTCASTNNILGTTNINTACTTPTNIGSGGATNFNGDVSMIAAAGTVLTITGNASTSAVNITGNSTTGIGALRLIGNPVAAAGDFILTINPTTGVVNQGTATFGNEILNGCQTGPIDIGTIDGSNFTLSAGSGSCVANARVVMNGTTGTVSVQPATSGTSLTVASGTTGTIQTGNGNVALPAYSFTASTDAGMYSPAAHSVALATGGAESISINGTQNVTIAAAASGTTLTVNGSASQNVITTSLGTAALPAYSFTGNTNTGMYATGTGASSTLGLSNDGTDRLLIDTTGSVTNFSTYKVLLTAPPGTLTNGNNILWGTQAGNIAAYNTGTGVWTVPATGYYLITFTLSAASSTAAGNVNIEIATTPQNFTAAQTSTVGTMSLSVQTIVGLTAGNSISGIANFTGTSLTGATGTMGIHYLSMNP